MVYTGLSTTCGFRPPLGSWNLSPVDKGGLVYTPNEEHTMVH